MVKLPPPDSLRLDKRTIDRYKAAGKLSQKEIDESLKSLPDEAKNAESHAIWDDSMTPPSRRISRAKQQIAESSRNMEEEDLGEKTVVDESSLDSVENSFSR